MPETESALAAITTIAAALAHARNLGLARMDAQLLVLHAAGRASNERAWLVSHDDQPLSAPQAAALHDLFAQRAAGVPVAYLTGRKEFYGLPLRITASVLDPRPDTETLVDWALELLRDTKAPRILDLGTGSGAIALALQHQRADATVFATDASAAALQTAQANGQQLGLPVQWHSGHWFDALPQQTPAFDLIVSNPPYLAPDDEHLPALKHEPRHALVSSGAHNDGLDDIRHIITCAPAHLKAGGWLLLEHGWQQHERVAQLLQQAGYGQPDARCDLAGHIRCTGARVPCTPCASPPPNRFCS